jgi:hypothetical protein
VGEEYEDCSLKHVLTALSLYGELPSHQSLLKQQNQFLEIRDLVLCLNNQQGSLLLNELVNE